MPDEPSADKPKIIIDEDWKSQVQAEKDAAKSGGSEAGPAQEDLSGGSADDPALPPASLEMLLTGLATEAMMSLGQIPHPATGEAAVQPNQAKYVIDTIEVIRDKTKGNLSPGESQLVETLLHELRMAFVAVCNQPKS